MEFTDSQKTFLNTNLKKEIDVLNDCIKWLQEKINKEIYIKYLTDKAEKENNIQLKKCMRKMIEYAVQKLEELEEMIRIKSFWLSVNFISS